MSAATHCRHADCLLPAVHDLAMRLGADPAGTTDVVQLEQSGQMRQRSTARWMRFRSKHTISTTHCAFDWRARFGPAGLVSVHDTLRDDGGQLDVRILGLIPILTAHHSADLTRGELIRYLAELAWAPDAILRNRSLRWHADGPDTLVVGAGSGETAAEVVLGLDGEGRIAGAFAPDRPRAVGDGFLPTPWRGRFSDYRRLGRLQLPFAGEVSWRVDGKEDVYWRGRIEHWESANVSSGPVPSAG